MTATIKKIGRYEVIRLLGTGGMGEVYQARDPGVDRLVAIKLLKETFNTEEFRERFFREARAAGKLEEHQNIVTVFEVRELRGRPFIVMQYISGSSLAQVIARAEPMSIVRKLEVLEELCAGLAWAHAAGIIHRDIKPGNVMLDGSGHVKIVDFGIAKSDAWEATSQQTSMGTPRYMSPEQLMQQPVDHRTDMFSTAVVAYELLTYRKLFDGDAAQQVARVLSGHIPAMSESSSPIPVAVERIVRRGLSKEPGDRFKDIGAMQRALASVRGQIAQGDRPGPSGSTFWDPGSQTLPAGEFPLVDPITPTLPSSWMAQVGIGAGVLCALTVGGWLLLSRTPSSVAPSVTEEIGNPQFSTPNAGEPRRGKGRGEGGRKPGRDGVAPSDGSHKSEGPTRPPISPPSHEPPDHQAIDPTLPPPGPPSVVAPTPPPDNGKPPIVEPPQAPLALSRADEEAIRRTLDAYEAAFEDLSVASVQRIYPSLTNDQANVLDREFANAKSYRVQFANRRNFKLINASRDASRASVDCTYTQRVTWKQGGGRIIPSRPSTIVLDRSDGNWLIERVDIHP